MMQHLLKGQARGDRLIAYFARSSTVNADSSVHPRGWHRAIDANNDGRISAEEYKASSSTVSPKAATDAACVIGGGAREWLAPAATRAAGVDRSLPFRRLRVLVRRGVNCCTELVRGRG